MRKLKYTDEPVGMLKTVKDFLPSADQLVFKERKSQGYEFSEYEER